MQSTNTKSVILRCRHQVVGEFIWVELSGTATEIHSIRIDTNDGELAQQGELAPVNELANNAARQLEAYFQAAEPLRLPLWQHNERSTQAAAMDFLRRIPCGQTRSYAQQAAAVRSTTKTGFGPRNAGTANHGNHYPLAIPCHRIVRSDGTVGGFMGSSRAAASRLKQALLEHEAHHAAQQLAA